MKTRDFHLPGRSPVYAREGMAATSHPLATQAAIETLRAGGTAADAAVTAVALLGVIEPAMTGIGGDCFCIVSKPGAPLWGYNGSGHASATVRTETLLAKGIRAIALDSIHAVTVPGAVEAWASILTARGGLVDEQDLANHRGEEVVPVSANYRGLDLLEIPPNGQGIIAQVMLNILEPFDLARLDPLGPERFHLQLEAARLAYAVRD